MKQTELETPDDRAHARAYRNARTPAQPGESGSTIESEEYRRTINALEVAFNEPIKLPPLTRASSPHIVIRFIHSDGKEHRFYSVINDLNGCRMTAFDNDPPSVDDTLSYVRSVIRDLHSKAKVIATLGNITA